MDDVMIPEDALPSVVRLLQNAGVVAISALSLSGDTLAKIANFAEGGIVNGDGLDDDEILRLAGVRR
jgi:bifunctional enzyme CysN/CysC/sulfate adenylyltransferase subunit 1